MLDFKTKIEEAIENTKEEYSANQEEIKQLQSLLQQKLENGVQLKGKYAGLKELLVDGDDLKDKSTQV